jgi:predicted esterase
VRQFRFPSFLLRTAALCALIFPFAAAPGVAQEARRVRCGDASYEYVLYSPARQTPRPAILLLHGAGGGASDMVTAWLTLARREDVVLIAPRLPVAIKFEEIAPSVFRCVVEDAGRAARIDRARVYVFGHSMGGYLAYDAAAFGSEFYAVVAVHAAAIAPEYAGILEHAHRKIPIAIYIGDRDAMIPLEGVRKTRDLLVSNGFPVHYREITGHDHRYALRAAEIDADAWAFLKELTLP